jgi:chitinase
VTLATSWEGEGESCGYWHQERKRSFCCDPPKDSTLFMPVPLDYLFRDPPAKDDADTDFTLKVDPTYGGSTDDIEFAHDPENSAFGFVVLTSPDELQVSLDKRDGSHWEVFDCFDPKTEGEHTVRMMCSDLSETSNCGKIHLGHGAPGTIVQMPRGCGPGKYAVTKSMEPSKNQSLPGHLSRRGLTAHDTIYDLTFDYNFRRVPRDMGHTLMRIDYSNQMGYWNTVVDKAANTKKRRKRSLHEVNGNHRRWLEEEWRDDAHFGALSKEDLHKRWFGRSVP